MAFRTQSVEDFRRSTKIEIGNPGVKRALNKYNPFQALAEFIWNGFDAGATEVDLEVEQNELGHVMSLRITDNGSGIILSELNKKFAPFLHSNKSFEPALTQCGPSSVHGKNGIGRLTFFKFAAAVEWVTVYKNKQGQNKEYKIRIDSNLLNSYRESNETDSTAATGTVVQFFDVVGLFEEGTEKVRHHLISEFCWMLELSAPNRMIRFNGEPLAYDSYIAERQSFTKTIEDATFEVRYVQWENKLHQEYSRFYFLDALDNEKGKQATSLNNKGDGFYHSVYVKGDYFDNLTYIPSTDETTPTGQTSLDLNGVRRDDVFRQLMVELNDYLKRKRKPFLKQKSGNFIDYLEKDKLLPAFTLDVWDQVRKEELNTVVREIYEVEPRLFNGLSKTQTQTMVQLFSLAINSSERDSLLEVVAQVVNLDTGEREQLASLLKTTRLSNIIATIKLIEDRFRAIDEIRAMVFNQELQANERDNLQSHIESHYWIFGEQYHLVTAAEPKFEEALRRYTHYLTTQDAIEGAVSRSIDHPDKNREMDIFAVRVIHELNTINNVVLELKHPRIKLGEKELSQVKRYMSVILDQDEFNANNMTWDFYLVGNDYDDYIEGEMESQTNHGERHLVHKRPNRYRIFVLKWSEVFANFEIKHKFLLDQLKLEREKISTTQSSADDIMRDRNLNSASMTIH